MTYEPERKVYKVPYTFTEKYPDRDDTGYSEREHEDQLEKIAEDFGRDNQF